MRTCLIILLIYFATGCDRKKPDYHWLDFDSFKLKTPGNWYKFKLQGIDSYVGGITNGRDSLLFDYGWYSPQVGDEDPTTHLFARDTVNGLTADIVVPAKERFGYIGMFVKVDRQNKFSIMGRNVSSTDTVLAIFKSAVFETSDTLVNDKLAFSKFKMHPYGNGKTLYVNRCAACHSMDKDLTGPALTSVIGRRSVEWLFTFFTDRSSIIQDSLRTQLKKRYPEIDCAQYPELTKESLKLLVDYLSVR
jgi:hypothetical protein